jgi:hypothetical protein
LSTFVKGDEKKRVPPIITPYIAPLTTQPPSKKLPTHPASSPTSTLLFFSLHTCMHVCRLYCRKNSCSLAPRIQGPTAPMYRVCSQKTSSPSK